MLKKFTRLPYLLCYLSAFVLGMKQLREPDMWWQLLTGEWMLENGEVTRQDMFSYTMEGTRWVNVKWLYEVIIAFLEKGLGPHGVMLLQSVVNVAIVYILLRILYVIAEKTGNKVSLFFSTIAVLLFLFISEFRMAGRPEMVSHLMTALYVLILWNSRDFSYKKIWWLIPLQCLWANMHEGYPVGIVIIALYAGGSLISYLITKERAYIQHTSRLGIIILAAIVVILINPNGLQLWKQPFEIFRQLNVNKYTTELFSFTEPRYWTIQAKVHVTMFIITILYWVYRYFISKKGKPELTPLLAGYLLSIPVFGYLSLSANRNIPFAQIMLLPTIAMVPTMIAEIMNLGAKSFYRNLAKRTVIISSIIVAIGYIFIVSDGYYKFTDSKNRYGIHLNTLHNPVTASEFIQKHNLKGPAFSDYYVSSYLLWDNYPNFKSYIDLRDLDIFSSDFFDNYFEIYHQPSKFYELDSQYKFNYLVLSTSQLKPLHQLLYWKEGFNVVHIDPVATVMLRESEENRALNAHMGFSLFTWPQEAIDPGWAEALTKLLNPNVHYEEEDKRYSPIYAGRYYNMVKNYTITQRMLLPAIQTGLSDDPEALSTLAFGYMEQAGYLQGAAQKSKTDSAFILFKKAEEADPGHTSTQLGLASMAAMRRDYEQAVFYLDNYIDEKDDNDFVYYLRGISARALWVQTRDDEYKNKAIGSFEESLELNEYNLKPHLYLADIYWQSGDRDEAREHIKHLEGTEVPFLADEEKLLQQLKGVMGYN